MRPRDFFSWEDMVALGVKESVASRAVRVVKDLCKYGAAQPWKIVKETAHDEISTVKDFLEKYTVQKLKTEPDIGPMTVAALETVLRKYALRLRRA